MTSYHHMSLADKQAHQRRGMREASVVCPICEVQTTARDLLAHLATRCEGRRDPHPASMWITWRDAIAQGVPGRTLARWARQGVVRWTGAVQDRRYLQRDIVVRLAARRALQRR